MDGVVVGVVGRRQFVVVGQAGDAHRQEPEEVEDAQGHDDGPQLAHLGEEALLTAVRLAGGADGLPGQQEGDDLLRLRAREGRDRTLTHALQSLGRFLSLREP